MKSDKLPPIDISEDIEKYEAHSETTEVEFPNCKHKNVTYKNGKLQCVCGAGWTGAGIAKLHSALTNKK